MRLIDADALIDIFEDRLEKIRNRYGDYSGEAGVCAGALHLIRVQPTIKPEQENYTELKLELLRTALYIDALLECSDEQKKTLIGFISRLIEFMPWTERG